MTADVNHLLSHSQKRIRFFSGIALELSFSIATGFYISKIFSVINPLYGAIYCGVTTLVSKVVNPIFSFLFNQKGAGVSTLLLTRTISVLVSVMTSAGISTLIGFPITISAALILSTTVIIAFVTTFFIMDFFKIYYASGNI